MRISRTSRTGGILTASKLKETQNLCKKLCSCLFDAASVKMAGKGEFIKVCISIISMNLRPQFLKEKS